MLIKWHPNNEVPITHHTHTPTSYTIHQTTPYTYTHTPYTYTHTPYTYPHTRHTTSYTHTHTPYTYAHMHTIHLHSHTRHTTDTTDTHCHLKQPTTSTRQCKHLGVWNRTIRFQLPIPDSSHGHQFIVDVRNFNSTSKLSRRGHC